MVRDDPQEFSNYVGLVLMTNGLAGEASVPEEEIAIDDGDGERYIDKAIDVMDGDSAFDNYFIGSVYRKLGEFKVAERFLLRSEEISPEDSEIQLELATLYENTGRFALAIERLEELRERDPDDPRLSNFLGYVLAENNERLELAEELVKRALDIDPGNGYYLDSLAWVKFKQGEYTEAMEILRGAISIVEDDPVIWEHLGDVYSKMSMPEMAVEAYTRSFEIDDDRPEVEAKLKAAREAASRAEKIVE
jgi:tetratricopeptide (TPR) repeat protein